MNYHEIELDSYHNQRIAKEDIDRGGRSQMFFKIGVLKNFAIFKGKHLS